MATYPPDQPAPLASSADMAKSPRSYGTSEAVGEHNSARRLLQIDGSFEALLGAFLMCSAVTGLQRHLDLPDAPASPVALVIFGLLFLAVSPVLWRLSRAPRPRILLQLAIANGAGALILVVWVLVWNRSFHPAGAGLALVVAAFLAGLAVLQASAAPPRSASLHR